ncbi:MAG: hypothetical protein WBM78_24160 [Desulfobacterales bacterium]
MILTTSRSLWADYGTMVLRSAVWLMAVAAAVWLGYEFWRLLFQSGEMGAIDLRQRHNEVQAWFAGRPVYGDIVTAVYPPASYVILWPHIGWLPATPARWFWALTTVLALTWLVTICVRESGADTFLHRRFIALIPLSMYATGATIGNGQLLVHILPVLVGGLLLLKIKEPIWHQDLLAAALVLIALVKPTVTAPFFWIVLFVPGRLRPAMLVSIGYGALSFFAVLFQKTGLINLMTKWSDRAAVGVEWGTARGGYANEHSWLEAFKLDGLEGPASVLALMILGFWVYRYRRADIWILMGVTALVARFWTYHMWYDDLLILLPMIALFRVANQRAPVAATDRLAGPLLAITILTTLAPGGLYLLPMPWNELYVALQTITWIAVLLFLFNHARCERKATCR